MFGDMSTKSRPAETAGITSARQRQHCASAAPERRAYNGTQLTALKAEATALRPGAAAKPPMAWPTARHAAAGGGLPRLLVAPGSEARQEGVVEAAATASACLGKPAPQVHRHGEHESLCDQHQQAVVEVVGKRAAARENNMIGIAGLGAWTSATLWSLEC
ncbi:MULTISPECIES: hypothetical protein [Paraburkholderia]|uniref:Uncharacterized protein n=1 Tax=Paraburkholderia podalyriae TaxID=1938811 RepID=A0ABR7PWV4_9BURK|nr:hypothetical protein [Paraburkholderia podalyriae]MBC8750738.1 hypothetical protein [Paraburkholderia podalyriae]